MKPHQLVYKDQLLKVVEFSHQLVLEKVAPLMPLLVERNELWIKAFLDSHTRVTKEPVSRLLCPGSRLEMLQRSRV